MSRSLHLEESPNQTLPTERTNEYETKKTQNKEEYWIDNIPPNSQKNFLPINQKDTLRQNNKQHNQKQQQHEITVIEETPQSQVPQEKTVIQEISESQLPPDNDKDLEFLSPLMVVTISSKTPAAINTSTPTIQTNPPANPKQYNTTLPNLVLYKKRKIIQQEKIQDRALKMTLKLAKFNYRDTGFLANATAE